MVPFTRPGAPKHPGPDERVRGLTKRRLLREVHEYVRLLDDRVTEQEIHSYLSSHSYFFNGALRLFGQSPLYSKIRFGNKYEADFVWFDSGSYGCEWHLAEIESPKRVMFTKAGNPSEYLTRAIQQVRDGHAWVHEHRYSARELMPHIDYPQGYVFIGRRKDLTLMDMQRLKRLSFEHRMMLEIHTLDWFASNACTVEGLLGNGSARWWTPSCAFTHSDLRQNLPAGSFEWLQSSGTLLRTHEGRQMRRFGRNYDCLGHAEWPDSDDSDLRKEARKRASSRPSKRVNR
jgi:hypothetical protein